MNKFFPHWQYPVSLFLLLIALTNTAESASSGFLSMQGSYEAYRPLMSNNAFNEPLHIKSSFKDDLSTGEIYALIDNEFTSVSSNLINSSQWCDMLVLHVNVKGCYVGTLKKGDAQLNDPRTISLFVGRNYYEPIEDAYAMTYTFSEPQREDDYVKTVLSAESGPFGTSSYLLEFEAIPLNEQKTFIHFRYSYEYGMLARIALEGYLATLGRSKVGFTVENYDENNEPVYVKGTQGIVERNSMRYFLAIRAYLDTSADTQDTWNHRIEHWYELAKPYKRQLLEIEDQKYLKTKREEYEKRVSSKKAISVLHGESSDF